MLDDRHRADAEIAQRKIFIGGLSYSTDDDKLRKYFNQYGRVQDAVVMKDPVSRRSRGFGFITFFDIESLDNALDHAPHIVDARKVEAKRAVPRSEQPREIGGPTKMVSSNTKYGTVASINLMSTSDEEFPHQVLSSNFSPNKTGNANDYAYHKIFVGGLHYDTRDADFRTYFEKYGRVITAEVMFNRETHKSRGFGFIVFDLETSVDKVCDQKEHVIDEKVVEVKRAIPRSKLTPAVPYANSSSVSSSNTAFILSAFASDATVHPSDSTTGYMTRETNSTTTAASHLTIGSPVMHSTSFNRLNVNNPKSSGSSSKSSPMDLSSSNSTKSPIPGGVTSYAAVLKVGGTNGSILASGSEIDFLTSEMDSSLRLKGLTSPYQQQLSRPRAESIAAESDPVYSPDSRLADLNNGSNPVLDAHTPVGSIRSSRVRSTGSFDFTNKVVGSPIITASSGSSTSLNATVDGQSSHTNRIPHLTQLPPTLEALSGRSTAENIHLPVQNSASLNVQYNNPNKQKGGDSSFKSNFQNENLYDNNSYMDRSMFLFLQQQQQQHSLGPGQGIPPQQSFIEGTNNNNPNSISMANPVPAYKLMSSQRQFFDYVRVGSPSFQTWSTGSSGHGTADDSNSVPQQQSTDTSPQTNPPVNTTGSSGDPGVGQYNLVPPSTSDSNALQQQAMAFNMFSFQQPLSPHGGQSPPPHYFSPQGLALLQQQQVPFAYQQQYPGGMQSMLSWADMLNQQQQMSPNQSSPVTAAALQQQHHMQQQFMMQQQQQHPYSNHPMFFQPYYQSITPPPPHLAGIHPYPSSVPNQHVQQRQQQTHLLSSVSSGTVECSFAEPHTNTNVSSNHQIYSNSQNQVSEVLENLEAVLDPVSAITTDVDTHTTINTYSSGSAKASRELNTSSQEFDPSKPYDWTSTAPSAVPR